MILSPAAGHGAADGQQQPRLVILRGGAGGLGAVRTPRDLRAELQAAGRLRHAMIAGALPPTPRHGDVGADPHAGGAVNDVQQLGALTDGLDSTARIWCDGICSFIEVNQQLSLNYPASTKG